MEGPRGGTRVLEAEHPSCDLRKTQPSFHGSLCKFSPTNFCLEAATWSDLPLKAAPGLRPFWAHPPPMVPTSLHTLLCEPMA